MKKLTIEEIKKRIFITHDGIVEMITKTYNTISDIAIFKDKVFGEWEACINKVCRGQGHPNRKAYNNTIPIEEIKKRVFEKHGDTFKIVESTYRVASEKALFIDKDYGEHWILPSQVMLGVRHPERSYDSYRLSLNEVKRRIYEKHKDLVTIIESTYKSVEEKATFKDKELGEWNTLPQSVFLGYGHPGRIGHKRRVKIDKIKKILYNKYGDLVTIEESTYIKASERARFIDKEFGEWWKEPKYLISKKGCHHPKRGQLKRIETNIKRYGYPNPAQNPDISLKIARKLQSTILKVHWKTREELVCQAGWEARVVDYLNNNKIDFLWQSKVFTIPFLTAKNNMSTYRPDLFLVAENKWVEIKGYMRPHSKLKWDWFHEKYPNSEIWGIDKLKELGIPIRS